MSGRESGTRAGKTGIEVVPLPRIRIADPEPPPVDDFAAVYQAHFDVVWRLARALGVDGGSVDDVVHEVFLVVRRRLCTFDRTRSMRAWLAGITRNTVMHHRRSLARRQRKISLLPEPEPPSSPDEWLDRKHAAAAMQRFLDGLDPAKREVFVLMEIERMTAREVEAIVGVNYRTLYTRLRAAREAFAAFTGRYGGGQGR